MYLATSKSFDSELCHCYKNLTYVNYFEKSRILQKKLRAAQAASSNLQDLPEEENNNPSQSSYELRCPAGDSVDAAGVGLAAIAEAAIPNSKSQPAMRLPPPPPPPLPADAPAAVAKQRSRRFRSFFGKKNSGGGGSVSGNGGGGAAGGGGFFSRLFRSKAATAAERADQSEQEMPQQASAGNDGWAFQSAPTLCSDGDGGSSSSRAVIDGPHYACSEVALHQRQHQYQHQQLVVNSSGQTQLLLAPPQTGDSQHQLQHQQLMHYACAQVPQNGGSGGGVAVKFRRHQQQHQPSHQPPPQQKHQHQNGDVASKRLSLPAPAHYLLHQQNGRSASPAPGGSAGGPQPPPAPVPDLLALSKRDRRSSLADIGFGKMSSYVKLEKLGQGTYATVFRGKSLLTDSLVALKEIRLEHEEGAPCTAIREVSLLRDLKHANIVTLHDIIHTEKSLTLVFEYLDKDLKQCLEECSGLLHEGNARLYLYQLIRGLEYCHRRRYLHRDLKPQNILLNQRGELKLADFGLARANSVPSKTYSNEVCTLWYRPADVLLGNTEYSTHIDLWGVGAIFFEMITGRPMFPGSTVEEQLQLIFRMLGSPTEDSWPGCSSNQQLVAYSFPHWQGMDLKSVAPRLSQVGQDLMRQLLQYQANRRISAERAKLHPYFMQFLPAILNDLPDTSSIFEIPGVCLYQNPVPNCRAPVPHYSQVLPDKRRQSMLF